MKAGDRKLQTLDKAHKQDTQIAASMVTTGLLSDQGLKAIDGVLKGANDPVQALAHVIFMALGKVREKLNQKGMHIDDKVWIAGGGVLDRVLFDLMLALHGILEFPPATDPKFVHGVKMAVLDLMSDDDHQAKEGSPEEEQAESPEQEQQEQQQGMGDQQQPAGLGAPQMGMQ